MNHPAQMMKRNQTHSPRFHWLGMRSLGKLPRWIAGWILAAWTGLAASQAANPASGTPDDLFGMTNLYTFHLTIAPEQWALMEAPAEPPPNRPPPPPRRNEIPEKNPAPPIPGQNGYAPRRGPGPGLEWAKAGKRV